MLVLTRRRNEQVRIGDSVVVTLIEVRKDGGVRLGIEAPRDLPVHREEVYQAIKRSEENQ